MGLEKPRQNAPVIDLLIKIFFNCVFWTAVYGRFCMIDQQFSWHKVLSKTNLEAGLDNKKIENVKPKLKRKFLFKKIN